MANVGYVGLGVMGSQMVSRLLDKGHSVTGYNRTRSKAEWLIKKGMRWADTPRAVAQAADEIFTMVTNSAALQSLAEGPDGILACIGPGKILDRHDHRQPRKGPRDWPPRSAKKAPIWWTRPFPAA